MSLIDSQLEYLVKWQCYDDSNNTWEPRSNLSGNIYFDEYETKRFLHLLSASITCLTIVFRVQEANLVSAFLWFDFFHDEFFAAEKATRSSRTVSVI